VNDILPEPVVDVEQYMICHSGNGETVCECGVVLDCDRK